MTQQNEFQLKPIQPASLFKSLLTGGMIGLIVILFFILGVDEPHPNWPELWWIRPLVITPIAAAMGGGFYYFINNQLPKQGWLKALAVFMGISGFIVALWLGTVLGLDGTVWN